MRQLSVRFLCHNAIHRIIKEITAIMNKLTTDNMLLRVIRRNEHVLELQRCKLQLDEAKKDFQVFFGCPKTQ